MYKVGKYLLDSEQTKIVEDESNHLLVVAGAGSGKTLTILGKIKYLVEEKKINSNEILCISFTRKAASSLEEKITKELNLKVPVYTFHKLALDILKEKNYKISSPDLLEDITHTFFIDTILNYSYQKNLVLKYFKEKDYYKVLKRKDFLYLEKNLISFIHLFKCNGYSILDFKKFFKKIRWTLSYKKYKEEKIFLLLAINILLIYNAYLKENNEIDFDDMIIKATEYLKDNPYNKKIKYIIIDEYQDTSFIRFNLIKELLSKTNSKLMVVGDDFQSIYHFTGCELDLFLNFKKYFKDAKMLKIQTTYRNSNELVKVAGDFVMKNPKQIKKKLKSNKHLSNPIKIIYYHNLKTKIKELILEIYKKNNNSILILGRNNSDINLILDKDFKLEEDKVIYLPDKNIDITYMTIHKSKGLESDNVIMINLTNNYLGLPSKIKENKILRLVSKESDKYPYSEERRLFYVGLTRTKNYTYLLVPKHNPSIFINELKSLLFYRNMV